MRLNLMPFHPALIACILLAVAAGCQRHIHSHLTGSSGGRSTTVDADGPAALISQEEKIILKVTGHTLVIERERLLVDEKERAKIPADAKKFDVSVAGGTLTVTADGAEILKAPLNQ